MQTFTLPGQRQVPDALQFSLDGELLAIQALGRVDVLDTQTGKVRQIHPEAGAGVGRAGVGFTADSRGVIYCQNQPIGVYVRDLASDQDRAIRACKRIGQGNQPDIDVAAPQADGRLVFVAINPEPHTVEIQAFDPVSGEQRFAFGRRRGFLRQLAVSFDGRWVAGASAWELWVWGIGGRKLPSRASWHLDDRKLLGYTGIALSGDGTYLAVGHRRDRARAWDLQAREELKIEGATGELRGSGAAFAPDRPLLALTQWTKDRGEALFVDVKARTELKRFDWGLGEIKAVAFSPDGCRCATASRHKAVIWDVDV
jgi:hypothetical protein